MLTRMYNDLISKILAKLIKKKLGADVDISISELKIQRWGESKVGENTHVSLSMAVNVDMYEQDLLELISERIEQG